MPQFQQVEDLIKKQDFDKAATMLKAISPKDADDAEIQYYRGLILQGTHMLDDAIECFQQALNADEHHVEATFHLAYLLDLHGEEERAIELYEKCIADAPVHVNALINLAVLYEDAGRWDDAAECMEVILDEHPNHARARLFLKDMKSSMTMYYDEDQERFTEARNAILDTPVSDFELSVRSRNCLKTMNMRTLGDLLRVTEVQLMAYKNFGDTSLKEIKTMLAQKGLRLGQLLEEEPSALSSGNGEGPSGGIGSKSVAEMELSVRARKCLQRLGISTIGELTQRSEAELLAIKNFGQTSLQEIKRRLTEFGLSLRSNK